MGLNLQSAATVINMDLPWNPAILEQRIGRVHRLGQKHPVRVVNFISEGTIEHGMLSLLAFKKSMFTGVLDGTADKVLMGDSALNRFMKTVEKAASSVPEVKETTVEEPIVREPVDRQQAETAARPAPDAQMLSELFTQGAAFLQELGRTLAAPDPKAGNGSTPSGRTRIAEDPLTGQRELRVALPDDKTLGQWVQRAGELFAALQGGK